ncbi:MAG: hypothetical protein DI621_23620 [Pseudomonas protegens]|nr:MAG: hypothetical protein DI621_23620 [Pseudomonas protegens]
MTIVGINIITALIFVNCHPALLSQRIFSNYIQRWTTSKKYNGQMTMFDFIKQLNSQVAKHAVLIIKKLIHLAAYQPVKLNSQATRANS